MKIMDCNVTCSFGKAFPLAAALVVAVLVPHITHSQTTARPRATRLVDTGKAMKLEKLTPRELYTPEADMEVRGASGSRSSKQEGFSLETQFVTLEEWTDNVTFTYYVATSARRAEDVEAFGGKKLNILSGKVTHTHIAKGRDHLSSIYVHPKAYRRFGEVEAYAVVVEHAGETLTFTGGKWKGTPACSTTTA